MVEKKEKAPHVVVAVLYKVGAAAWADVSRGEKKCIRTTIKASLDIKDVIYQIFWSARN